MNGGTISGTVERYQRSTVPNHRPTIGGRAAMADSQTTTQTKTCPSCGEAKPMSAFCGRKDRPGLARVCGQCRYRRERAAAIVRPSKRAAKLAGQLMRTRRYGERHPLKTRAHALVSYALRSGVLVRPSQCGVCARPDVRCVDGRTILHAHHEDYSQPLVVEWLCASCHIARHRRSA